ncbi:hypothetical protein KC19_11G126300 [Ceratodon purpureus]|uniref:Leucine-rich repeat-containing N-terminal plant-type domain-containing protein n=1 Tax=Ceratodon purpureus TaxID=3225 RepID=A0A8T0GDA4_CERPU|nr:hypothetical protein KC19_11G126300 [Ceratodon purpureus]
MTRRQEFGFGLALLLLCTLGITGSLAATCSIGDRDALLAFKNQLTDSSGLLANWMKGTDCCTWTGIRCNAQAKVIEIYIEATCKGCGPNGQFLIAKNTNNFGKSLATLRPTLKTLALINVQVQLKFPIPPTFFTLTNLNYLNLESCEFIGSIPKELGNLVNLEELRINGNKFSGGMPDSIGKLQKLKVLELRDNQAPTLGSSQITLLKKLTTFDYQRNKVTGPLPKWLGGLSVGTLTLAGNQFSGPISPELCKLRALQYLLLRGNKLSGSIPGCIGNVALLFYLDVGRNMLSGPLPRELGKLKQLTRFLADNNRITGPLPREIGDLPTLFFIEIQNNKITGRIPSNYGPSDPIAIDPINFTNNMLSGPIPPGYQNLDETAFRPGNPGLCGPPLSNPC